MHSSSKIGKKKKKMSKMGIAERRIELDGQMKDGLMKGRRMELGVLASYS